MKKATTSTTRTGLSMRWVPVTTDDGRVRMEMRWSAPPAIRPRSLA
ncbi:hypothetical protein [Oryzobacter terrae]